MPTATRCRRVLVVDRFPLYRRGLCQVLADAGGYRVVGSVDTAPMALHLACLHRPDLVVLGHELAGVTGLAVAHALRERAPGARPVCLAARLDDAWLLAAAAAGVLACLPRHADPRALLDALRAVAVGERPILALILARPAAAARLVAAVRAEGAGDPVRGGRPGAAPGPGALSAREVEVLDGVARGLSTRGIAAELCLGEGTVKGHVSSLLRKVGADNRTGGYRRAVGLGWVRVAA